MGDTETIWTRMSKMTNHEIFYYIGNKYLRLTGKKLTTKKIADWLFVKPRAIEEYRFSPHARGYKKLPLKYKRIFYLELFHLDHRRVRSKSHKLAAAAIYRWQKQGMKIDITRDELIKLYDNALKNNQHLRIKKHFLPITKSNIELTQINQ